VARAVLHKVLETSLRLLHPFIPFVTEEIWQRLPHQGPSIAVAPFPKPDAAAAAGAGALMDPLIALVTAIRTIRATYEVDPRRRIKATIAAPGGVTFLRENSGLVESLCRIEDLGLVEEAQAPPHTIVEHSGPYEVHIPMAGLFDIEAEKARLSKEQSKLDAELLALRGRLANPQFVERAKPEVVAEARTREIDLVARLHKISVTLRDLGGESAA
jgi:valyl-tRNA synthetase